MPITESFLHTDIKNTTWNATFTKNSTVRLANDLNNELKKATPPDPSDPKNPTWANANSANYKDPNRLYKLLTTIIPGVKKITYHVKDAQLEVETDRYTYTAARNGSKEVGIQWSDIVAKDSAESYNFSPDQFAKINSNTTVNNNAGGWARAENKEYQNFSNLIGKDPGIVRTNVLTDKELSDKIIEKLGPGNEKLGKGGYFSTADIPLGTDIVSYTVQVIPADNERVGANPQSSRIQYNMPILADFSVLQDTTEPSKEVARRIITKLKEKGKITEDQEKKIKEKIDKSKKTSEVRSAMSGDVKVKYQTVDGTVLTLDNTKEHQKETDLGKKDTDGTYIDQKDQLLGTDYDVTGKKLATLTTTDGKRYRLKRSLEDNSVEDGRLRTSASDTGTIAPGARTVTYVYEEYIAPPTGKGLVHFKKQVSETTTEALNGYPDINLEGDVGTDFSADSVNAKITELKKAGYEIVTNEFDTKSKTIDSTDDVDGQEPSQVYNVTVREKVVDVPPFEPTNPKGDDNPKPEPGQPIDPENPNGPKWTKALIDKLETTKHVTRTITYVEDGTDKEVANKATDKVTFTRSLKVNVVTGDVVDPNVAWTSNDTTFDEVTSPVVKGYILKADQGSEDGLVTVGGTRVAVSENLTATSENQNLKVVYTKLGSWVPKVPGVETPTPLSYPNHPTDPTKPGEPEYPQLGTPVEPNTPVIPYVPGYTPKTPNGNPLEPVDPNHPENGYKVPPVPTEPGNDTPITYVKDGQQKAITSFVDPKGNVLETPITETGDSNTPLTKDGEIKATIAKLKLKGYDVETNTYPPKGMFDNDPKVDQYFKVTLTPRVKPVKPFDPTNPKDPNKPVPGQPIDPDTPVDPNNSNDPTIPRWTEDLINKLETTKQVTRTINYVDETGNKVSEPSTDKVTFTREAKINVVTGEITYGDWKAVGGDSTFDKVSSPVVKGYILKDPAQKEVAERKGITPTVANQTIEVVYKKLGSWIPKVPGVETPTPLPYPNHPTDPTKPGDPTDPNTPNVPVIPYVPGYTPKIGETPLQPKVPNDPTQGYIPPVPTEPGKDTPIEYVKVPNTPSPEEPVKPTPESNHITIWVDENGKPLKPEQPGTHEAGNIPGYRFITTTTKDGVTIHRFEKISPVEPNNPVPQKPTTPIPTPQDPTIPTPESQIPTPNTPEANTPTSETSRREELPNTGTEANASLARAGIMTLLAGLGLGFFKKKEDEK